MSKALKGFLLFMLVLFLSSFMVYQVFFNRNYGISTELITRYTAYDSESVVAYFAHSQSIVTYGGFKDGDVLNCHYDGQRVQLGGVVAEVFPSVEAADAKRLHQRLGEQIAAITELSEKTEDVPNISILDKQIETEFLSILNAACSLRPIQSASADESLLLDLGRRASVVGAVVDYQPRINELKAEQAQIKAKISDNSATITAPQSGFFVQSADGFEEVFTEAALKGKRYGQIAAMQPQPLPAGLVGTIISDSITYIYAPASFDHSANLKEGDELTIIISALGNREISVVVESIVRGDDRDDITLKLRSDILDRDIAMLRKTDIKVNYKAYSGLRVNSRAVRTVDSVKGVYVLKDTQMRFAPMEILFSYDGYFICKYDEETKTGLRLYDEVIIDGRDLYDRKNIAR